MKDSGGSATSVYLVCFRDLQRYPGYHSDSGSLAKHKARVTAALPQMTVVTVPSLISPRATTSENRAALRLQSSRNRSVTSSTAKNSLRGWPVTRTTCATTSRMDSCGGTTAGQVAGEVAFTWASNRVQMHCLRDSEDCLGSLSSRRLRYRFREPPR